MWLEVEKNNPSYFKGDKRPMEQVSWWDAIKFCNEMSKKYNLEPVYKISYDDNFDREVLKINQIGESPVEPDKADFRKTEGFRLPTEVEWEWFARGGEVAIQDGTFDKRYSGSDNSDKVAWYSSNSGYQTHKVGTKLPNQLGLFDCCGNVWEWCYDTYIQGNLPNGLAYIYDKNESSKRLKGGSWYSSASGCVVVNRDYNSSTLRFKVYGFRLVRTI